MPQLQHLLCSEKNILHLENNNIVLIFIYLKKGTLKDLFVGVLGKKFVFASNYGSNVLLKLVVSSLANIKIALLTYSVLCYLIKFAIIFF